MCQTVASATKVMVLKEGMVICIEPMVTMGDYKIKKSQDGLWF